MNRSVLLIAALLALPGCTVHDKTITQEQATARVEELIRATAAAISPTPRLVLIPYGTGANTCLTEGEPQAKVTVNRAYWLRDIPKEQNMNVSRQVKAYWEAQGHRITAMARGDNPDLNAESQPDHYILSLSWAKGDKLYLGVTSTCVWPDGSPPQDK